jgi:hypothetical protein
MSSDDGLQDSIERTRQAFRAAPDAPPLVVRRDDGQPPAVAYASPVPPGLNPFFRGLLETLPEPGASWPQPQREQWLETARHIFALVYTDTGEEPQRSLAQHPSATPQYDQLNRQVS